MSNNNQKKMSMPMDSWELWDPPGNPPGNDCCEASGPPDRCKGCGCDSLKLYTYTGEL